LIELNRYGLACQDDLSGVKSEFSERHVVRLPQLLDSDLTCRISQYIERVSWTPYEHPGIGRELKLDSGAAPALLNFVVNTREFLSAIELITQCSPVRIFSGRVYRMTPGTDDYDTWHTDAVDNRLVGMSLNLGPHPYRGGVFQMRKSGGPEVLCELPNITPGDAILFRLSPQLEHRITPMEGETPKIAFAGWFSSSETDLFSEIRKLSSAGSSAPLISPPQCAVRART
jgi:hypothetical protein